MCSLPTDTAIHLLYSILKIYISHKNRTPTWSSSCSCAICICGRQLPPKKQRPKSQKVGKKTRESAHLRTTESDGQFDTRRCGGKAAQLRKETWQRREASTPKNWGRVEGNPTLSFFWASGLSTPRPMDAESRLWLAEELPPSTATRPPLPTTHREKNGTT